MQMAAVDLMQVWNMARTWRKFEQRYSQCFYNYKFSVYVN